MTRTFLARPLSRNAQAVWIAIDPEAQAEVVALTDRYEAMWQSALKDLKRAGLITDDSRVARLFLMGALNWTVQWYRPDGSKTIEQLARQLADFVIGKPGRA
jgi:hypothetical protein